jgi:hypothetical protein
MAGYSDTRLRKKLGIKDNQRVLLLNETPLVDVKVCAINDTWSGLKFVIRKTHGGSLATGTN